MPDIKKNNSQNKSSLRFNNLRAAHQTELAEDYVEMIYELINEKGEARAVDLASRFGVSNPTVNASIQRLQKDVEKIMEQLEVVKDKVRANGKSYQ